MVAYSFNKQFVEPILLGTKRQTIIRLPASQIRVEVLLQAAKLRNMADARAQAAD